MQEASAHMFSRIIKMFAVFTHLNEELSKLFEGTVHLLIDFDSLYVHIYHLFTHLVYLKEEKPEKKEAWDSL